MKQRVAVLRGGPSDEYDVSLITGKSVLDALDPARYEPLDVILTKNGEWLMNGRQRQPEEILQGVDIAFIGLHGAYGEDGQVQRLLERLGVPYTGSRPYQSAIALNKAMTKDRLSHEGIKMARHMLVGRSSQANLEGMADAIFALFGPDYVVKPVSGGSSLGTQIVQGKLALVKVLASALSQYEQVIVEERISGREATCGVVNNLRNQALYALPVVEIVPPQDAQFFDYSYKYNGRTEEICPARFSSEEKRELESLAARVHNALELSQYSRSDFIVSPEGVYFLEVNTLPGLTPESLMPKGLAAVGISYQQFIEHLIEDALSGKQSAP